MLLTKVDDKTIGISFRYMPHLVAAVKTIPGRWYDSTKKCWMAPVGSLEQVQVFAKQFGFRWSDAPQKKEIVGQIPPMPELEQQIDLALTPFPYQAQGIAYSLLHKRCIIGDEPGLGKTGQAIAAIVGAKSFPCLIICPSTIKINWQREVEMWTGRKHRAVILSDGNKRTFHQFFNAGLADFCIVNYESLKKFFVDSINVPEGKRLMVTHIKFKEAIVNSFKSILIDESHRCKNGAAQQTKFCMGIAKGKEMRLLLTGTPIVNRPKDLIPQLHILGMLEAFGNYKYFVDRYCNGPKQASNLSELNYRLRTTCFYRREKKDVLKDLPDKIRKKIVCDISNRKEYSVAENDLIKYLRTYRDADDEKVQKAMKGQVMVQMGILRQISAKGKIEAVKEYVNDLLETGQKVILFVSLHEIVLALKKIYPKAVTITGMDTKEDRQRAVDSFQRDAATNLIICSIKAAGVGLTLTASSNVGFVEFPWTYADCCQCEDRAHRIGQKDSVTCGYFLGQNTVDERVYEIIQEKKDIANRATGADDQVKSIEENVVNVVSSWFADRL